MFEEKQMKTKSTNSIAVALSRVPRFAGYASLRKKAKASTFDDPVKSVVALLVVALLGFSNFAVFAHPRPHPPPASAQEAQEAPKIPNDQLDSLVAPIALYPDPLLSQTLVASTYTLEIMQLHQWLQKNPNLNEKALTEAVSKQPWDASIKAMAELTELVKRLADDI